jgi:hypothetical protein
MADVLGLSCQILFKHRKLFRTSGWRVTFLSFRNFGAVQRVSLKARISVLTGPSRRLYRDRCLQAYTSHYVNTYTDTQFVSFKDTMSACQALPSKMHIALHQSDSATHQQKNIKDFSSTRLSGTTAPNTFLAVFCDSCEVIYRSCRSIFWPRCWAQLWKIDWIS